MYKGQVSEPLYSLLPNGQVSSGENDETPSFFQEYKYKLEKLYSNFFTRRGTELAKERQQSAIRFYNDIFNELNFSYINGQNALDKFIQ